MLNELVKQIWFNSSSSQECNQQGEEENISFWLVVEHEATEKIQNGVMKINKEKKSFTIIDKNVLTNEKNRKKNINYFEFEFHMISRFKRHKIDMFQWNYKKSPNDIVGEEFGILINSIDYANFLHKELLTNICNIGEPLLEKNVIFQKYCMSESKWIDVCTDAIFCIKQRATDLESYVVVCKSKKEEHEEKDTFQEKDQVICQLIITNEMYFFPIISERKIKLWVGDIYVDYSQASSSNMKEKSEKLNVDSNVLDNNNPDRDLPNSIFAVIFCNERTTYEVSKTIDLVLLESREGKKLSKSSWTFFKGSDKNEDSKNNKIDNVEVEQENEEAFFSNTESDIYQHTIYDNDFSMDICEEDEKREVTWDDDEQDFTSKTKDEEEKDVKSSLRFKAMEVGCNKTFIIRSDAVGHKKVNPQDTQMQIFGFDEYGREKIAGVVDGSKFKYESNLIIPSKMLLHDDNYRMYLMNEEDNENVFMMDLNSEKIVNKWDADGLQIKNLVRSYCSHENSSSVLPHKYSNRSFLAYNPQNIFFMDERLPKHARTNTLSYTSKVNFSCAATDANGSILMGSSDGSLRLFDGGVNLEGKIKKAKTHLRGLGDALLHTVVTKQGDWILATCAKYLVLYPVRLASSEKNGFTVSLGQKKPKPIVLKIKLDDIIKYNLQNVNFNKAHFNEAETAIITATDKLVIIWDFIEIKKGNLFSYSIRMAEECINDVAFLKTLHMDTVVFATPSSLSTRALKRKS